MAITIVGRQLTEAHRLAQARIGAAATGDILTSFALLDPTAIDSTIERWLRIAVPAIVRRRETSAQMAASYLTAFRTAELGPSKWLPSIAAPAALEAIITSLTVTGPISLKKATGRGVLLDRAVENATVTTAKAAMRHVLSGSRDTIMGAVETDDQALGYARSTSGSPCSFCAMVAGRGFVYKTEKSAGFEPHDGCNCQPEPAYSETAELPPGSDRYAQLWAESTAGLFGDEARNAFRRALDTPADTP